MAGVGLRHSFELTITDSTNKVPFIIVPGNNQRLNVRAIDISTLDISGAKGGASIEQCFFDDIGSGYTSNPPVQEDSQYTGTVSVDVHKDEGGVTIPVLNRIISTSIIASNNCFQIFAALNERDGFPIPGGDSSGTGKHRFGLRIKKIGSDGDMKIHGCIRFEY